MTGRFVRFRRIAPVVIVWVLACGVAGAADVQQSPSSSPSLRAALQTDLDAYLRKRSAPEHLSSLSLTVSLGKNIPAIRLTSGTSRYHAGSRVTPASLYQIGSITKAFTAVAVLQLEAQGRVSIDAPIGSYLPQYPAYAKLTLRQLLNMTGGIETYDNLPVWDKNYVRNPFGIPCAGFAHSVCLSEEKIRARDALLLFQYRLHASAGSGCCAKRVA